jgi:hypothetical protein
LALFFLVSLTDALQPIGNFFGGLGIFADFRSGFGFFPGGRIRVAPQVIQPAGRCVQ